MAATTPRTTLSYFNPQITVHVFHGARDGAAEAVNSIVLETEQSVILFDLPLIYPVALEIKDFVQALKKPIRKVVISHGHPDHWFGLHAFADLPSFAAPGTIEEITQFGEIYLNFKRGELSQDLLPPAVAIPRTSLEDSDELIDGVKFSWRRVQRAEYADGLYLSLPQHRVLVSADLIYNRVHQYLGQKDSLGLTARGWITALKGLNPSDYNVIVPGHGSVGDNRLIAECLRYVETALPFLEAPGATAESYGEAIKKAFPDYEVEEMIGLTAYFAFQKQ